MHAEFRYTLSQILRGLSERRDPFNHVHICCHDLKSGLAAVDLAKGIISAERVFSLVDTLPANKLWVIEHWHTMRVGLARLEPLVLISVRPTLEQGVRVDANRLVWVQPTYDGRPEDHESLMSYKRHSTPPRVANSATVIDFLRPDEIR